MGCAWEGKDVGVLGRARKWGVLGKDVGCLGQRGRALRNGRWTNS